MMDDAYVWLALGSKMGALTERLVLALEYWMEI